MTNGEFIPQFQELIRVMRVENDHMTLKEVAETLALPEYSLTFTRQAIWKWTDGRGCPSVENCRLWALFGATPLARQFGRDGLAIYGLRLIEGGE